MEPQRQGTNTKSEVPGIGYYVFLMILGIVLIIAGTIIGIMMMKSPDDNAVHTLDFRKYRSYEKPLEKGHYQIWYKDKYGESESPVEENDPGNVIITDPNRGDVLLIEEGATIAEEYAEWVIFASFEAEETGEYTFKTSNNVKIYITTPFKENPYYYTLMPFGLGIGGGVILMCVGIVYIKKIQKMKEAEEKARRGY